MYTSGGISLVSIQTSISEGDLPEGRYVQLSISDDGLVAYIQSPVHAPFIRVLRPTGTLVAAFGQRGAGPGEMQVPTFLRWDGRELVIGVRPGVLARFDTSGALLEEYATGFSGVIYGVGGDRLDGIRLLPSSSGNKLAAHFDSRRLMPTRSSGSADEVATTAATGLRSILDEAGRGVSGSFGYGRQGIRWAIGDGVRYRGLVFEGATGALQWQFSRDLGPRHRGPEEVESLASMLQVTEEVTGPRGERMKIASPRGVKERLASEIVPYFQGPRAIHFDRWGRVWVTGTDQDAAFLDVFAASGFLGRFTLPCMVSKDGIALAGEWFVFQCADREMQEPLHVYRLTGAGQEDRL